MNTLLKLNLLKLTLLNLYGSNMKYVKGKVVPVLNYLITTPMRRMGSGGMAPPFLTSTLDGVEWLVLLRRIEPPVPIG
jgi:hypothetical protein